MPVTLRTRTGDDDPDTDVAPLLPDVTQDTIPHIFLPRQLSGTSTERVLKMESKLLHDFSTFLSVSALSLEHLRAHHSTSFGQVVNLFNTWALLQDHRNPSPSTFSAKISELGFGHAAGASFAFYVREQNATILLTNTANNGRLRFSTFAVSQSNDTIFKANGDLVAEFPGSTIDIPVSQALESQAFAENILRFCSAPYDPAHKTFMKASKRLWDNRDGADPWFITHYVTAALTDHKSIALSGQDFRRIRKKIRDRAVIEKNSSGKPFRRSGLWMSMKIVLQLELVHRFGETCGTLLYKLLVLDFITKCSENWCLDDKITMKISLDLTQQMIAKISRRLAKIRNYYVNLDLELPYYQLVCDRVRTTVKGIHDAMDSEWMLTIAKNSTAIPAVQLNDVEVKESTTLLQLASFQSYQKNLSELIRTLPPAPIVPKPPSVKRFRPNPVISKAEQFNILQDCLQSAKGEENSGVALYDIENYIFSLPSDFLESNTCYIFFQLMETYLGRAQRHYDKDPVGRSRMILAFMKGVLLLDVLAVGKYQLLEDHRSGVNETIVCDLLMTKKSDAIVLGEIESYFRTRNENASLPSLIGAKEPSHESFSVRFGEKNADMVALRLVVLDDIEEKCQGKRWELVEMRKHCAELRKQAKSLEHETKLRKADGQHQYYHSSKTCKKCLLEEEIKECKVPVYEKPMPEDLHAQLGIVFEFLIPDEIACLRDALFVLAHEICAAQLSKTSILIKWASPLLTELHCFTRKPATYQNYVTLGRTSGISDQGVHHVDHPDSSFILENYSDVYLCTFDCDTNQVIDWPDVETFGNVKKFCTFEVQPNSSYADMQWMLKSTNHSQNKVLATQCNCPTDLSLAEYKEFGSLRAGHRLQYRNLLRAIAHQALSFQEESVVSLVCQTIWEAGPPPADDYQHQDTNPFRRESHEDINADPNFTSELLRAVTDLLAANQKNWNDEYLLLTIILVCNRILAASPADETCTRAIELNTKCRYIALSWTAAIEEVLTNKTTSTTPNEERQSAGAKAKDLVKLRLKLTRIAACGALTFTPGDGHLMERIVESPESFSLWLLFITKIDENILLSNSNSNLKTKPLLFTRNILRWVRCVGMDLEVYFHAHPESSEVLSRFVAKQWTGAPVAFAFGNQVWERCSASTGSGSGNDQWYSCIYFDNENKSSTLQMDVVLGKFLVDGHPLGRLPPRITKHPIFVRMFGDMVFLVQNSGTTAFITKERYNGCSYKFQFIEKDLLVTEMEAEADEVEGGAEAAGYGTTFQLVPHTKFSDELPSMLVSDFSHWKDESKNVIQFRSQNFSAPGFKSEIKYEIDLSTRTLIEKTRGKLLIGMKSEFHERLADIMCLEKKSFLHMFLDTNEENGVHIELPRLGLHFSVTQDGIIQSKEFSGFRVRESQEFGTLIGLRQRLLLASENANPILLVPHGQPKVTHNDFNDDEDNEHQVVTISIDSLRKPAYFVVEVDETLRRLKTQPVQCAWLYLAHLHALTSGVLPDPFTGLTGTESALGLLQSPLCWSHEPMDSESFKTLRRIQALSPSRTKTQGRQGMEAVEFPSWIPSLCAHDGFLFLVHKIKTDSSRMAFAFESKQLPQVAQKISNRSLFERGYWRTSYMYSPQGQVSPHQIDPAPDSIKVFTANVVSSLELKTSPNTYEQFEDNEEKLTKVRYMADLGNCWRVRRVTSSMNLELGREICNTAKLESPARPAPSTATFREFQTGFYEWKSINVVTKWLKLYNYARAISRDRRRLQGSWTLMLTAIAYSKGEIGHLEILQTIAVHANKFQDLDPPPASGHLYADTNQTSFDRSDLEELLRGQAAEFILKPDRSPYEMKADYDKRERDGKDNHARAVKLQITQILNYLENKFEDLDEVDVEDINQCQISSVGSLTQFPKLEKTNKDVKARLLKWYWNWKLRCFIVEVQKRLEEIEIYSEGIENSNDEDDDDDEDGFKDFSFTSLIAPVRSEELEAFAARPRFNVWTSATTGMIRHNEQRQRGTIAQNSPKLDSNHFQKLLEQSIVPTPQNKQVCKKGKEIYPIKCDAKSDRILEKYNKDLEESWSTYAQQKRETKGTEIGGVGLNMDRAQETRRRIKDLSTDMWNNLVTYLQCQDPNCEHACGTLRDAGLLYRLTPTTLLPLLCDETIPDDLREQIEQVGVAWTHEQKIKRCLRFAAAGSSMQLALSRELATLGYESWSPRERPEWLLLQLDMDLMIRRVQIEVAENMIKKGGHHSLMQLNMGEGKTSVIIPMLVSIMANGSQLARVTVLKSLFNTNKNMLAYSIGGLLNRRVYSFPCRRDMNFKTEQIQIIQSLYEECMAKQGVVMTPPEDRLSFQLKLYEKAGAGTTNNFKIASALYHTNNWLYDHTRDVLDECDEILNAKYQLIYTTGKQELVYGGSDRWVTCQKLLKALPEHLRNLCDDQLRENPDEPLDIEFIEPDSSRKCFPSCRILKSGCYPELCTRLAEDILANRTEIGMAELNESDRRLFLNFLTCPTLETEDHKAAEIKLDGFSDSQRNTLLILRGLLAYGILLHCMSKRWRVNYGVNPAGHKKMAVPFRAKDIASDRTEFGQSDVAILLTQLSYYYSGLSGDQVRECILLLVDQDDKELEYKSWVEGIPDLDPSISSLAGVNLADYDQTLNITIPTLYKNTRVVDFWLGSKVYPHECKQFPQKLTCTPWDLCRSGVSQPVTGFSGTNDTTLLLPLTIKQEDLDELKGTNGEVLYNLLKPENKYEAPFPLGVAGREILERLVQRGIPLLLDVGALMIDLSNEGVAEEWLALTQRSLGGQKEYKAALYFNDCNEITVLDREGRTIPLNVSPYRTNLEDCLIYLDDVHTRGTDLKIPRGTKGCVTLGKGVTKDKLVQGCMRMRMLGNGHSIGFFASQEVDAEIRKISDSTSARLPGTKDVVIWALNNSSIVTQDGFQHWITAALNYYTKMGAELLLKSSNKKREDFQRLGELCSEDEVLKLKEIYASFRKVDAFHIFVQNRLNSRSAAFERRLAHLYDNYPESIMDQFDEGKSKVFTVCRQYTKNLKKFTTLLDEEQERELEPEQEEERQKQRPGAAKAATHFFRKELAAYVKNAKMVIAPDDDTDSEEDGDGDDDGEQDQELRWCLPMPHALRHTNIWKVIQKCTWATNMYATTDFCRVVKDECVEVGGYDGEYVRPPTWLLTKIISQCQVTQTQLLLLSPFEANQVKKLLSAASATKGNTPSRSRVTLHMFAPRLHPDHSTFWLSPQLAYPSDSELFTSSSFATASQILNANLLLFSGSLFFQNEVEQNSYCNLLGFVPTPRNKQEQKAVEKEYVRNGWLLPNYRDRVDAVAVPAANHSFKVNPSELVRRIIESRHETFPRSCHVAKIVHQLRKPLTGSTTN